MTLFDAILLGLVQGLAEFLPISSSGHLVIFEYILGADQASIIFEVFLHFATLLAILIYFKKDILSIKLQEAKLIMISTIPAAIIGILFKDQLEAIFGSILIVSLLLIVTGILNLITDRKLVKLKGLAKLKQVITTKEIGIKEALIIGFFQAFAILPGISRSGSTVASGILQNVDRVKAFRFSFLMVIPVILGASILQLIEAINIGVSNFDLINLFVGGLTAFLSGFMSLKVFEYVIKRARLEIFGYYCIGLGLLSALFILF